MISKGNLEQTLDRVLAFHERRLEDGILAQLLIATPAAKGSEPEARAPEVRRRPCPLIEDLEGCLAQDRRQDVTARRCDVIPCLYPTARFGESIWSGMLGGDIVFMGDGLHTWSHASTPAVGSLEYFQFPQIARGNPWFDRMLEVTQHYVDSLPPAYDVKHFIFMDCMNLLVELRGPVPAYMDIHDTPGLVARFMEWSIHQNIAVFDAQRALAADFVRQAYGGHPAYEHASCNKPDLSVDAYGVCDKTVYERFGLEYHKSITNHYGGARLHVHSDARHLLPLIAKIENLTECFLTDDIGYEKPCRMIAEAKRLLDPVPVRMRIPRDLFLERLSERSLPGGMSFMVTGVTSLDEANQIMDRVFDYRPRP